ncbi:DapH/DapD/GlmU-related protein [Salinivibrio sp. VYel1]|uniref:acyltransferase n=1 Tax=Salinivibrio sp. VYel1 TaxID=2490490 RepID=UPI001D15D55F|nr:DapH/DapD/GlmU-related protein [Salinivibrio sp. VYel1]
MMCRQIKKGFANYYTLKKVLLCLPKTLFCYFISFGKIKIPSIVEFGVKFYGPINNLYLGKYSKLERNVIIQTVAKNNITIGERCTIGEGTMIRPSSYYGGDIGMGLTIKDGSAIGVNSYIGCSGEIVIGRSVIIGPRVTMIAENHNFNKTSELIKEQGVTKIGITIKDNVWIGANVTILDGVTVGENSIIAAGAVVNIDVLPNSIVAGVPAKLIKMRDDS